MTRTQARMVVDAFTVVIIASVALALAALTWRIQGYSGASPATAPVAPGSAGRPDVQQVVAMAPFGTVVAHNAVMGGTEELTLKAIFAAVPMDASVALIADASGQVAPFSIGEATPGGIIEAIENERVLLRSNSGLRSLSFLPATASGGPPAQPRTASAATTPAGSPAALPATPPPPPPAASVSSSASFPAASPPPSSSPPPPGRATGVDAIRSLIPRDFRGGKPE